MSQHLIPDGLRLEYTLIVLAQEIRQPDNVIFGGGGETRPFYVVFNPDLTTNEQAILDKIFTRLVASMATHIVDLDNVPNWATYTGQQAQDAIHAAIFNGQDAATVKANIAAQLTDITTANVSQINARLAAIRTLFATAVDAIVAIRGILENMGKLLAYIRDIALR